MPTNYFSKQWIWMLAGPLSFMLILLYFRPSELSESGVAVLATTVWMAIWWITEAVPISATALLPIVLFPLTGGLDIKTTTAAFGHKYVFLYLGGFLIAIAIEKWNLHRRVALSIIRILGSNLNMVILGFMLATAFLSMWISNTATSVMMLPIGIAIIAQMKDDPATELNEHTHFGKALMLAIAYSASIGGMATLIGTPPNLVLAGVVEEIFNTEISFWQWFRFGFPISVLLLMIAWLYLTRVAFKLPSNSFRGGRDEIKALIRKLGPMGYEEKCVLIVFLMAACLWIGRTFIQKYIAGIDDTIIAMASGLLLFVIPQRESSKGLLNWDDTEKLPWGVILLFGGGLALAQGFQISGLATWIGMKLLFFKVLPLPIFILVLVLAINFLTEMTSNLATTAMFLPILAPLAVPLGIHHYILMVSVTVAASCAFMLPVATPPNAIVFGSGYLTIKDMMKVGLWMNLVSALIISLAVYYVLPLLWQI